MSLPAPPPHPPHLTADWWKLFRGTSSHLRPPREAMMMMRVPQVLRNDAAWACAEKAVPRVILAVRTEHTEVKVNYISKGSRCNC